MKNILLLALLSLVACKQSDKYSVDNIYPIPKYDVINTTKIPATDAVQEAVLQPYFDDYYALKADENISNDNKPIYYRLKDLSYLGNVLGHCEEYDDANVVWIDSTFFASANTWDIHSVVYHEMGHCDLGRGHRTLYWQGTMASYDGGTRPNWGNYSRYLADGVTPNPQYRGEWPLSLMHRSVVRQAKFQTEYNYYIHELFHPGIGSETISDNVSQNCEARYELDGNIHFE